MLNINRTLNSGTAGKGHTYTIGETGATDKVGHGADWEDGKSSVNEGKEAGHGLVLNDDNVNIVDERGEQGPGGIGVKVTIDRQVD